MQCNLICEFIEPERDTWFYLIQNWTCPANAWDWREDSTCVGPFKTYEEGSRHLKTTHTSYGPPLLYPVAHYQPDDTYRMLISGALAPKKRVASV
jgi:hypothetical protein